MGTAVETRAKLLETAIQLIWQSNYHQVGINDICSKAGVTKGAFYYHFQSKADLFYEAGHYYWEQTLGELDHVISPKYTSLEQLHNLIDMIVERQLNEPFSDDLEVSGCPIFTAGGQVGSGEQRVIQCSQELSNEMLNYHVAIVRGLKGDGLLNGDPDILQISRIIHQYIQGLLIYGRVFNSLEIVRTDLREAIYRIVDLKQEYRILKDTDILSNPIQVSV
ncbi:TetR/AcrR family transcriptional regulator [Sneathiella marina]|uniref:TetR/AcrR family transcriptional regulator n=1 Tax=Sneathiella marina TaxID=2950108 RepID=A0ABY4W8F5_9PROT|nr:TetR/AcrR family transcriptional regulator [Sneathiella marina]USG62035.1 TetR/AcrR family transcriptional regulator [Sneathiella marina]